MADLRTITSADYMSTRFGFNIEEEIKAQRGLSAKVIIDMAYEDIILFVKQNSENLIKTSDVEKALIGYTKEDSGRRFAWYKAGTLKEMQDKIDGVDIVEDTELTVERKNAFKDAQSSLIISYFTGLREKTYTGSMDAMPVNQEAYSWLFNKLDLYYKPNELRGSGW